jgi:HAL2 family 3'(2'),5'-bisphosphate nucleotidase
MVLTLAPRSPPPPHCSHSSTMAFHLQRAAAIRAVLKACRVCELVQSRLVTSHTISKKDKSPVTVGDFSAQCIIINELTKQFDYPFIAEEESKALTEQPALADEVLGYVQSVDARVDLPEMLATLDKGRAEFECKDDTLWWTLDPIDGTKGFLRRGQYAVALALMQGSKPVLGVLGCPSLPLTMSDSKSEVGCVLVGSQNDGSFQMSLTAIEASVDDIDALLTDERKISVNNEREGKDTVFVESVVSHGEAGLNNENVRKQMGISAEFLKLDSQAKYAVVARGEVDAYLRWSSPTYNECIWDHAAGAMVVSEAGGLVTDALGRQLDYGRGQKFDGSVNQGVLCTSNAVHQSVVASIRAVNPFSYLTADDSKL